jgi:hypothetical protein
MKQIERLREGLGGVTSPKMQGDNLAILLCSHFDNPDQGEDENGWTEDAIAGMYEVLDAIHQHYAKHIDALEARVEEERSYIDNAVSKAPEPLRQLGEYLAGLLDEDQWPHAERYLNAAAIAAEAAERALAEAVEVLGLVGSKDELRSSPSYEDDPIEQFVFEVSWELEEADLKPGDLVTVNREKLRAIAKRVFARAFIAKMGEK